ncbi:MAG TPA: hypothetical protein VGZ01_12145 [Trinickia sp.]|nr:hypothetical protein [Trinickia sp.]
MLERSKTVSRLVKGMVALTVLLGCIEYSYGGASLRCSEAFAQLSGNKIDDCPKEVIAVCTDRSLKGNNWLRNGSRNSVVISRKWGEQQHLMLNDGRCIDRGVFLGQ